MMSREIRLFLRQLKLLRVCKLVVAVAGAAILVIPLGLAILATEFLWARRWL